MTEETNTTPETTNPDKSGRELPRIDVRGRVLKTLEILRRRKEQKIGNETETEPSNLQQIREYVAKERYGKKELGQGESVEIPTTQRKVTFVKESSAYQTDRGADTYKEGLFSGEYIAHHPDLDVKGKAIPRTDGAEVLAGGETRFFEEGETFLDLGPGEAVALLEYYLKYYKKNPKAKFIGVDRGYQDTEPLDIQMPGAQLIHGVWDRLEDIPDNSVDRILSVQGAFTWSKNDGPNRLDIPDDTPSINDIVQTITRIARKGAILRFDCEGKKRENNEAISAVRKLGWDVDFEPETAVAVKLN
jgi:hypothetical protein